MKKWEKTKKEKNLKRKYKQIPVFWQGIIYIRFKILNITHKYLSTIYNIRGRVVSADTNSSRRQINRILHHSIQTLIKNVFLLNFADELLMSFLITFKQF